MIIILVVVLVLIAMLILQISRRTQDVAKATRLRRFGLLLAVIALLLALADAFGTALDQSNEQVPTLTGNRLP